MNEIEVKNGNIIISCAGGCGKTSEEVSFVEFWKGKVEQDGDCYENWSGVPIWTCRECVEREQG